MTLESFYNFNFSLDSIYHRGLRRFRQRNSQGDGSSRSTTDANRIRFVYTEVGVGAHVIIFARRHGPLDEARKEIVAAKQETKQEVRAVSLDLGDASEVCWTSRAGSAMFHIEEID